MPSRERDNAKTAHGTAAILNLQWGSGRIGLPEVWQVEVVARHGFTMDDVRGRTFLQGMSGGEVRRQIQFELMADDQVDASLACEPFQSYLSVTAGYGDECMGRMFQGLANEIPRCSLSVFGHRAGIENEQVCGLAEFDQLKPFPAESLAQHGRFRVIQSATQRVERCARACHGQVL
jgi:hypothetical protein